MADRLSRGIRQKTFYSIYIKEGGRFGLEEPLLFAFGIAGMIPVPMLIQAPFLRHPVHRHNDAAGKLRLGEDVFYHAGSQQQRALLGRKDLK